ncbi:hypothetical protein BDFB_009327 [Asbolus verrucosus]|uniref:Uncharacterized protein n=1 Tax=Asbolus verrucosus TaxID=1661398 RepID=A0A482VR65_ASBVE|nr:hypothetical protein BDFB_009327 [Asbolus verrucosus]
MKKGNQISAWNSKLCRLKAMMVSKLLIKTSSLVLVLKNRNQIQIVVFNSNLIIKSSAPVLKKRNHLRLEIIAISSLAAKQDTSLDIHNSNIKETSPESETKISYNNQQFGFHNSAQKPSPFSNHNINNKEVNPESETESGSNQRFGIQKSAQKPVYSNKNYGFQQETVFTNGSFKSVVTFNVKPVSTGFTSPEPVTKSNSYSNLEHKSVTSNSRAGFQHFKTFNEEFIENNEEEKHGTSTERQSVSSTTSTSLHFDNRNEVPTKADIVTSQKDNLVSTTPSTSFQDETRVESTPQIQISSGFYGNESEATTTVSDSSLKLENSTQLKQKVPISTGFPNQKQEVAFSTVSQNQNKNKNLNVDGKDGTVKQKSTVPLTRNDIVNRRLEPSDSDEAQITQETASFYKNSFNRIDQNYKTSSPNPHPNHRETYSDLKEPKYYSSKILSAISSVTPQYLTTQPINNGRPFIGSQVGTTLRKNASTVTTITTTRNYFSTTIPPITTSSLFNLGRTDASFTTESTGTTTELFNVGSTYKISQPIAFSTQASFTTNPPRNISIPAVGSFNVGPTSTSKPRDEASTKKVIDHATVYGKFVKSSATTPSSGKISISLSKSLSGGHQVTPSPLSIPFTPKYSTSSTSKTSAEILSTSDSYNSGIPQVRFSGKVSSTIKTPGVEIHVNGNSKTSPSGLNSFSTTPKPRGKSLNFVSTSPAIINSISTTPNSIGVSERVPTSFAYFSTTPKPFSLSSTIASNPSSYFDTNSFSVTTPSPNPFGTTFTVSTTNAPTTSPSSFSSTANALHFNSLKPTTSTAGKSQAPGFYVTRNGASTSKSILGEIARPRPFDLPPEPDVQGRPVYSTTDNSLTSTPTYPTYKISSASPFKVVTTLEPTQPTPFTTANPTLPSTFENVDSMINALAEMANQKDHSTPRPGLVIPPSAGPQTLHTLAVYFASALDGIASDKEENEEEEDNEENLTESELEKKKLTELLTQMTMNRYNELFSEEREDDEETTTIAPKSEDEDNDLEGQHSKNPTTTPKVRQLAKVFTQALSSYLDDPATFKKVLEEIRPTEPPALEKEESTDFGDDELLNFSDADTKSSYPPFFPTPPSVRPTWGYLIAYNTSQNLDVKNTINPTDENLQGADSQSFVSQFNKLQNKESTTKSSAQLHKESTTKSSIQLPEDHWTTSPGVTKLWNSAFSFDPASINENFETTEATTTEKETEAPEPTVHHEIKYELRALPQLELNSTQVHGILIDFMNTTKFNHNDRLQRILRKLNTTEDEFLAKMKEIETNPLTRRLILLLISECAANSTAQVETKAVPVHTLLSRTIQKNKELLETSSFSYGDRKPESSSNFEIVDPSLDEESQDTRALQLLNSLYTIASKFGKK